MKGFQQQLQNQLYEMETAAQEILRSGKEEFDGSMMEYKELQMNLKKI